MKAIIKKEVEEIMLKLTSYEQDMLSGKFGAIKKRAMEHICNYAKILNVDELCEVTMSTIFGGAHSYLEAAETDDPIANFSIMNMISKEILHLDSMYEHCMCQTCAEPLDAEKWQALGIDESVAKKNEVFIEYLVRAGAVRASTCTPYLTGWIPVRGQHFVTTESSNVLLSNSLFGACANAEGIESSFWATICGRIPKYGMHDQMNRYGTCLVEVECPIETPNEWDLLGYVLGKKLPKACVPVLRGEFINPNIYKYKQFSASLIIVSDIDMCHVVGLTPEAATVEMAFGGKEPQEVFTVNRKELEAARKALCNQKDGKVSFVNLGCPHYSIFEIQKVANFLLGKKVAPHVKLLIWTSYSVKELAERSGYGQIIRDAGADIYTGACPYLIFENESTIEMLLGDRYGAAFDSIKMAYGMPNYYEETMLTYFGEQEKCLEAAVNGFWRN